MTLTQIKKLANNQINTDLTKEQAKELKMQPMTYLYFEGAYIVVCRKDGSVIIYESNGIDEDIEYINKCLMPLGYIKANENNKDGTKKMKKLSAIAKNIIINRIIDNLKTVDKKAVNDFLSDYIYNDSDFNSCNELYNTVVNDYMQRVIILGF